MFEAKGLSAGYGRAQVLWDVDLSVGEKESVALIGPNGAARRPCCGL
jgi:branched-chain amino acid transport system ATP-binding protein